MRQVLKSPVLRRLSLSLWPIWARLYEPHLHRFSGRAVGSVGQQLMRPQAMRNRKMLSSKKILALLMNTALLLPGGALAQTSVGAGTPGQSQTGNDPANSNPPTNDPGVAYPTNGNSGTDGGGTTTNGGATTHHQRHHALAPSTTGTMGAPAGTDSGASSTGTPQ